MKIKAKNPNIASMKLIVPVDGLISIDAHGVVEVSDACAEILVNRTNDWQYEDETSKSVNDKEGESDGSEGTENNEGKTERELLEEKVKSAKVDELKEMCSEAGFPEDEWKNLTKALLAKYILSKYDEADDEEED